MKIKDLLFLIHEDFTEIILTESLNYCYGITIRDTIENIRRKYKHLLDYEIRKIEIYNTKPNLKIIFKI